MKKDYTAMTSSQLWAEIERRFGDETETLFEDKEKLCKAFEQDDGLLDEYSERISRGR